MLSVFQILSTVLQTRVSWALSMIQFTLLLQQHAVLLDIHTGHANIKISECLGVNLKTVLRIFKKLNESNQDYEGMAA